MSYEIPLSASQAISEAGRLASSVDVVSTSLKNAVLQSDTFSKKLQETAKHNEVLKNLAVSTDALGNSVRRLNADVIGQNHAMLLLADSTKKATAANAQYAQQVVTQQGRILASLEKEVMTIDKLRERRVSSDKAILASSRESSNAIIAQLKLQNQESQATGKAVVTAQRDQANAIKTLQKNMQDLNRTLATLNAATRKQALDATKSAQAERLRTEEIAKSKSVQRTLTEETNRASSASVSHAAQLKLEGARAEESARAINKLRTALASNSAGLTQSRRGFVQLSRAQQAFSAHSAQATAVQGKAAVAQAAHSTQLRQSAAPTLTLTQRMAALSAATTKITGHTKLATQATSAMRAGMIASGTSFGIFTSETIVAAVAVYGIVSALKAAITVGADFEDSMTRAFAIMGVTGDFAATSQLNEFVREIGKTTKFTATEAAQGLVLLGMAGLDTKESMDALGPALNIASIGMVDMAFSADLVTNVMNEFGMESLDIAHISDVLAVAVTDANVSIEQMGLSLSYIGPIASSTNNSLEDTVAMIQLMGDNAIKASRAGTSLRRAMSNLLEPNDKSAAAMSRLGVSIRNVDGDMIPLIDFMKQMAQAGADVTDVFTLFGVRAGPGMMTILKDLQKGFDENGNAIEGYVSNVEGYAGKLGQIAGEAQALRKEIEDTVKADAKLFTSAMSELALVAFEEFHTGLRSLIQTATDFVRSLDPQSIQEFTRATINLAQGIGTLVKWGAGLYALYKVVSFGAGVWTAAALASQAATFAAGASVGPLTQQASAYLRSAAAVNAYTPAALRGAAATTMLSTALATLSAFMWPLLAIGAVAAVIYTYSSATSTAADTSAKLRAEMGAEAIQADRLKVSMKELNKAQKEGLDLKDQVRLDANNDQMAAYREQLEGAQKSLTELTGKQNQVARRSGGTVSESFLDNSRQAIDRAKLEIVNLQDLVAALETDSNNVRNSLETRDKDYNGGRPSGIPLSQKADKMLADTIRQAQAITDGLQNAASDAITNLQKSKESDAGYDLGKLLEKEVEKSDARIELFEKEQGIKGDLVEAGLSREALIHENSEKDIHSQRKAYQQQSFDESIVMIDQEIAYAKANKQALEDEYTRLNKANIGGDTLEQPRQAYMDSAEQLRVLMDLRQEYTDDYGLQVEEMKNKAAALWISEEDRIRGLVSAHAPLIGALIDRVDKETEILELLNAKQISEEDAAEAMRAVKFAYDSVRTPLAEYAFGIQQEIDLLNAQETALRTGNYEQLVSIQLKQAGTLATADEIAAIAALMKTREDLKGSNKDLKSDATEFSKAWQEAVSRVDEAFEDAWAGAFDSFTSFRDRLVDAFQQMLATIAHHAITKPILVNFGVMPTGAPGSSGAGSPGATGGTTGAGGTGGLGYLSMLSGGITGTLGNVSMFASDMAGTMGFKGLSQSAYRQGSTMASGGMGAAANLGLSVVGGVAGSYAGGKVGEAVFGKEAESNIAATIGGALGTIMGGPWGAFIGASIGAMVDVAFGGDGRERASAGFSVGDNPEVRSKYEYGTQTFDSGLQITNIARRVDQQVSDKVIEQFSAFDSAFTAISQAADIKVDFSKTSLMGTNADSGTSGSGSFFGAKGYNGLGDTEAQLAASSKTFVQNLIAEVSGSFSSDVRKAIDSATGDAQQILTQYEAVLSLNSLFTSGSKLFTNIDTFGATMDELSLNFMENGESLGEMVNKIKTVNDTLALIDIGDGSSGFTQSALAIADAAGGVEELDAMVRYFTDTVVGREQELENVTDRLSVAVAKQFSEIGLSVDNFDVETFSAHFDDVKDSVDALDLVKLIQAGNALSLLTDMEGELAAVRAESFTEFASQIDDAEKMMVKVRSLSTAIQDSIDEALGTVTAPGGPASDSISDQIDYINRMQDYYEEAYKNELKLEEDLHKEKVSNYKEQIKLSEQIGSYLDKLAFSDLSTLTSKERRDQAYSEFNSLAGLAEGGDLNAAAKVSDAAQAFLELERERETTSDKYVSSYNEVVGRLSGLKGQFGLADDPGEFNPRALLQTAEFVSKMEALGSSLNGIANTISISVLDKLDSIDSRIALLPEDIRDALQAVLSGDAKDTLNYGTSLGVMKDEVVSALGLLPNAEQLSSLSVAEHIENLTNLSQFPNLLSSSFSNSVGTMLEYLVSQGTSVRALADAVIQNPAITSAADQYIQDQYGSGSVADYTTNASIGNYLDTVMGQDTSLSDKTSQIFNAATANGVSAAQLAAVWNQKNPGQQYTADQINATAAEMGLPMFAAGGVVTGPTIGMFGEAGTEVISPVKEYATLERENLVSSILAATSSRSSNRDVVDAVNRNTEAVKKAGSGSVVHLKVVTVDGKVVVEETINTMKQRSRNGEIVVHAKGVGK